MHYSGLLIWMIIELLNLQLMIIESFNCFQCEKMDLKNHTVNFWKSLNIQKCWKTKEFVKDIRIPLLIWRIRGHCTIKKNILSWDIYMTFSAKNNLILCLLVYLMTAFLDWKTHTFEKVIIIINNMWTCAVRHRFKGKRDQTCIVHGSAVTSSRVFFLSKMWIYLTNIISNSRDASYTNSKFYIHSSAEQSLTRCHFPTGTVN